MNVVNKKLVEYRATKECIDCEEKTDCFAYREKNGKGFCTALNALYCKHGKCNFYKKDRCDGCNYKNSPGYSCIQCKAARQEKRYF